MNTFTLIVVLALLCGVYGLIRDARACGVGVILLAVALLIGR